MIQLISSLILIAFGAIMLVLSVYAIRKNGIDILNITGFTCGLMSFVFAADIALSAGAAS